MIYSLYSGIHKFIRHRLFVLSEGMAKTDYSSPTELSSLKELFENVSGLLGRHSRFEDTSFLPLIEQKVEAHLVKKLEADHNELENVISELKVKMSQLSPDNPNIKIAGYELYLQFNLFLSRYLQHLQFEESDIMAVLAETCTLSELEHAQKNLNHTFLNVDVIKGMLPVMLPVLSPDDQFRLLSDFKRDFTNDFGDIWTVAKAHISHSNEITWRDLLGIKISPGMFI